LVWSRKPSGRRGDVLAAFGRARTAGAALGTGRLLDHVLDRLLRLIVADRPDRRRKEGRDTGRLLMLLAGVLFVAVLTGGTTLGPLRALTPRPVLAVAITALEALGPLGTILPGLALGPGLLGRFLLALAVHQVVLTLILILVSARTLVLEARTGLAENSEIMVGELEVIFGLDTIAGELGIASHVLVLLEQLRGIAADALITAAVAAASAATPAKTLRTLTSTTATAAALAIVHQVRVFLDQ
jgi:hypothetical protein